MTNEEKTAAAEAGEQSSGESTETPYEQARQAVLTLEDWDDIADVELLRSLLKEQRLLQTEKEFIISILAEKSKRLKMSTEFKKILSAVKKEVAKDRDYMRSTYNFISFFDAPLSLARREYKTLALLLRLLPSKTPVVKNRGI